MLSLWIVLVYMMADVIGRGHGGDGAEEPPPPGGDDFWRGHGADVPRKKTRGKAKNLALRNLVDQGGQPLDLTFDEEATNMPIGTNGRLFARELGLYMWRHIPLDREGFRNVPEHYRNALFVHLKENFNLTAIEKDDLASQKKGGINCKIQKTYNNRKSMAKAEFLNRGGYADVERARASVPDDMTNANWQKAVDHFLTIEHQRKSVINAAARKKQLHTYRGGTTSYASACFKQNLERYDGYRAGHTDREGRFDSPENEENYEQIASLLANLQFRNGIFRAMLEVTPTPDLGNQNHEEDQGNDNTDDDDYDM